MVKKSTAVSISTGISTSIDTTQNSNIPPVDSSKSSIDTLGQLIKKEMATCASLLELEAQELQAWIDNQIRVPKQSLLHLLRTCKEHRLDPLQEEVQLVQYGKQWQVIISVDGWLKLIHQHPQFAGLSFAQSLEESNGLPIWMECTIYRNDHHIPTTVREYLAEVQQDGDLWQKMPRRMLRHRTLQQCARVALGVGCLNSSSVSGHTDNADLSDTLEAMSSSSKAFIPSTKSTYTAKDKAERQTSCTTNNTEKRTLAPISRTSELKTQLGITPPNGAINI
jgi:RecT family